MSRKHFGTDGIRGRAGRFPLDARSVYALGRAAGAVLGGSGGVALVAMDPRESSGWIAERLIRGLSQEGVTCRFGGVLPTAAVAMLCTRQRATFGAMVSASHNPYGDNGIKFFSGEGFKLSDEREERIEEAMEALLADPGLRPPPVGEIVADPGLGEAYLGWLLESWRGPGLQGRKVVLDCANGAAHRLAPALFRALGAEVDATACEPDGRNINAACGSLHAGGMAARTRETGAAFGFSFDGDADRCMTAAPSGRVLDGDYILYREALRRARNGALPGGWVVGTVMSNLWLEKALSAGGLRFHRAPVGDRYVLQCLQERGGELGGEPSGHILFLDRATTGDGLLTAMAYASLARDSGGMESLGDDVRPYPQVIENLRVARRVPIEEAPPILQALAAEERDLAGSGRIVLRYSGTEPLLRLMAEAETDEVVAGVIGRLSAVIRKELGEG